MSWRRISTSAPRLKLCRPLRRPPGQLNIVSVKKRRDLLSDVITLARLIRTAADKRARAHGMTRAQWGILVRLEEKPGLLQKELADILEVEPITVARLIDRLEARGMVERRPDPMDRRCWRLHLTDASRPLMNEIDSQLGQLASITTHTLDDATLQAFDAALTTMRDAITEDLAADSPPD